MYGIAVNTVTPVLTNAVQEVGKQLAEHGSKIVGLFLLDFLAKQIPQVFALTNGELATQVQDEINDESASVRQEITHWCSQVKVPEAKKTCRDIDHGSYRNHVCEYEYPDNHMSCVAAKEMCDSFSNEPSSGSADISELEDADLEAKGMIAFTLGQVKDTAIQGVDYFRNTLKSMVTACIGESPDN